MPRRIHVPPHVISKGGPQIKIFRSEGIYLSVVTPDDLNESCVTVRLRFNRTYTKYILNLIIFQNFHFLYLYLVCDHPVKKRAKNNFLLFALKLTYNLMNVVRLKKRSFSNNRNELTHLYDSPRSPLTGIPYILPSRFRGMAPKQLFHCPGTSRQEPTLQQTIPKKQIKTIFNSCTVRYLFLPAPLHTLLRAGDVKTAGKSLCTLQFCYIHTGFIIQYQPFCIIYDPLTRRAYVLIPFILQSKMNRIPAHQWPPFTDLFL